MSTVGGPFRVARGVGVGVGGAVAGQVGIRKSDATKPFIPQHEYKMAPERLTNSSGRSTGLCVLKKTHTREGERGRECNSCLDQNRWDGWCSHQQREGKIYTPQKKHKHSQHLPNLIKMQLRTGVIS